MKVIRSLRNFLASTSSTAQSSEAINAGIANQSDLLNRRWTEMIEAIQLQTRMLNEGMRMQLEMLHHGFECLTEGRFKVNIDDDQFMNGLQAPPKSHTKAEQET